LTLDKAETKNKLLNNSGVASNQLNGSNPAVIEELSLSGQTFSICKG
jgi:hypothetical protein